MSVEQQKVEEQQQSFHSHSLYTFSCNEDEFQLHWLCIVPVLEIMFVIIILHSCNS